jgi:hypothetical protein
MPQAWLEPQRNVHAGVVRMDVVVLAIGIGFFALMFGYISVCERL